MQVDDLSFCLSYKYYHLKIIQGLVYQLSNLKFYTCNYIDA